METNQKFKSVDVYISGFPVTIKKQLKEIRAIIREAAPGAEEIISYNMPAYRYHGVLVYFAGYKNHIGFYPTNSGITQFKELLSGYKNSKGAVQFPIDAPLPITLIKKIVKFRMKENRKKEAVKKATKKSSKIS